MQNPVNHRVLNASAPEALGRGHVCLGVTHCVAPPLAPSGRDRGADIGLPCARARLAQMRSLGDARHEQWWLILDSLAAVLDGIVRSGINNDPTAPIGAFDCDPRSGGITR
ncbi:hypothetical protein MIMGU_mgv1a025719mg [Erythranthe guttata]|uniref:Uncharacterized protein n=1 Tax=Erythranthe guttata TaxID=4155 RepID=A0A022PZQ2_ERYGU|nr:hypothetical protein MIMGU_mgv1a025719mg [Erythranthe guttata]